MSRATAQEKARCGLLGCDIPVIVPTTMTDMQTLRNQGLREATLNQINSINKQRLAYIKYRNGSLRINIWSKR